MTTYYQQGIAPKGTPEDCIFDDINEIATKIRDGDLIDIDNITQQTNEDE